MNLMIRITRSFLSLISFAMSVRSEASIPALSVCCQRCEREIIKKMFRFYQDQLSTMLLSQDGGTRATSHISSNAM